ncbi:MAG: hypothetical protein JOZ78_03800 [Chroococcidiopsidaceae cyanobacterium CP_BM_ER_R8_30]|nr:hypothetical protein [Chroococcidiopsidaceae cyanobacterium CP_BM_ER_R8_30]
MKTAIASRIAATAVSLSVIIILSSCGGGNNANNPSGSNTESSPSASTTSPSETATTSPSSSASPTAQTQGVAPQGTTCPSGNPIKAVNSKRLGKIAVTTKSPNYTKTKPEKCFPDVAAAQKAGYKVPK